MNQSILIIRILMVLFCATGGYMVSTLFADIAYSASVAVLIGALLGAFLVLIDVLLKGFSLRALSGLTFGLFMGILASHFITISPLFDGGDAQVIYISRLCVFIGVTYLSTVIALRGRDEFNLVIPYVRFEPQSVELPLIVLDTSALVDGRIIKLAKARLLSDAVAVPKFIMDELHELSISDLSEEKNRGGRGLKTVEELKKIAHLDFSVVDSELNDSDSRDEKMLFVVSNLKGRLFTTSEGLQQKAKLSGVAYVDALSLGKAMAFDVEVGETLSVKIVKLGKEDGQGVGYLEDGSMVVVNQSADLIGSNVLAEVESIIPTSGGRMVFGKLLGEAK
jgi:uncharacterized protein YacL